MALVFRGTSSCPSAFCFLSWRSNLFWHFDKCWLTGLHADVTNSWLCKSVFCQLFASWWNSVLLVRLLPFGFLSFRSRIWWFCHLTASWVCNGFNEANGFRKDYSALCLVGETRRWRETGFNFRTHFIKSYLSWDGSKFEK